ncbi:Glycine dehydrogenase (decarboxylating) [Streptomyces fumanus]
MTAPRIPLTELEQGIPFEQRHIGPDHEAQAKMLAQVGYGSLDELTAAAVPEAIRSADALDLPGARSEAEVLAELRSLADRNQVLDSMIGLGYYGTFTPPVILRNVMENPAWYTAYTPYQPEISQGRLEALLNFQTMVAGPHRAAHLRRLAARRGHRRRRGDGAVPADGQEQEGPVPGRRRRAAADHRRDPHPRRTDRRRGRRRRPERRHPGRGRRARCQRRPDPVPGRLRSRTRHRARHRPGARAGRAGHRRRRPAGADPAEVARRAGRRHRGGHHPAVRGADGLRRTARRIYGGPGQDGPQPARTAGRRLRGRGRQPGLPARPADP